MSLTTETKWVHVAVGVIYNTKGNILIAQRAAAAHQGGLWEFPGGKLDAGEAVATALIRELKEELDITPTRYEPLIQIRHHYKDKSVLLDVYKVLAFTGEPKGNEGQPIRWVPAIDLPRYDFPAANRPIVTAIGLPHELCITGQFESLDAFKESLRRVLDSGVKLVQLRAMGRELSEWVTLLECALALAKIHSAAISVNCSFNIFLQLQQQFPDDLFGLHLNSHALMGCQSRPLCGNVLVSASCHSMQELHMAEALGVDYVVLSPVQVTSSHPDASPLGWEAFAALVATAKVPVYALGGMRNKDLACARQVGAQGIAAISNWWV